MPGDWIKIEHTMPDKPEVSAIASSLAIDHDAAAMKCVRFWIWCDQHSVDGNVTGMTPAFIDRLTNCPGFSVALIAVGWLIDRNNGRLSVPHFDRHNGQTAKARALTSDRVKRARNAASVTKALPEREREREKRRRSKEVEDPLVEGSSEPFAAAKDSEPAILVFPCVGGVKAPSTWALSQGVLDGFRSAYPGVDCLAECRKALAWCETNPAKRKTAKGMAAFLNRWLAKEQDHCGFPAGQASAARVRERGFGEYGDRHWNGDGTAAAEPGGPAEAGAPAGDRGG